MTAHQNHQTSRLRPPPAREAKIGIGGTPLPDDVLVQSIGERKNLTDLILARASKIAASVQVYDVALKDYGHRAVKAAKRDVVALRRRAGTPVDTTASTKNGPPDAPEKVRILPAHAEGSLFVKHSRPEGSESFAVEYKLEPSLPGDPWLSPQALQSTSATHQLNGLAVSQLVRVRVRALGDGWGPYSVEVVGRAK